MLLPLDLSSPIAFSGNICSPQSMGYLVFQNPVIPVLDSGILAQGPGISQPNPTPLQPMVSSAIWELKAPKSDSCPLTLQLQTAIQFTLPHPFSFHKSNLLPGMICYYQNPGGHIFPPSFWKQAVKPISPNI